NITVGVVYARASSGGAWASVLALRKADDKAQALFDNCFRILDGPDAPDLDIEELDRELILYLTNPNGSNNNVNYPEDYAELDPTIPEDASDRYYHFQGYQVYQVRDGDVGVADVGNEDLVRLLGVYDLDDGVDRLINWIYDQDMGVPVATEMVNAPDTGVVHSIKVTEDLFATGDKRLVNYKTYYYMALAYGYNNFQPYNPDPNQQSGQAYPFKAGRKSASGAIRSWSGIPHPPASELGGTIQNAQYGDQFAITRLEGQGNGGLAVAITRETEDAIVASPDNRMQEVKYLAGFGPVKVKVVDPLRVPDAHFELYLKDTTSLPQLGSSFNNQYTRMNDAWWTLVRINPDGSTQTVDADRS
ncbi:MAG TPA: T9SS C-terminal target domain-containing protein, partial [Flavobacteriales bacterium]|nr:T9SS C-terminal target domain-containing protein [Flavobacteriales bacterium]